MLDIKMIERGLAKPGKTKGGLAAALLSAWQDGDPAEGKARMLAALNAFYNPKQSGDDASANPPD